MKKIQQTTTAMKTNRPYVPHTHPQQARIDAIRDIPSLVTTTPQFIPTGK
jgi:hypothetical protein